MLSDGQPGPDGSAESSHVAAFVALGSVTDNVGDEEEKKTPPVFGLSQVESLDCVWRSMFTDGFEGSGSLSEVASRDETSFQERYHSLSPGLETRLQDIEGVASVTVDLTESGGGINVRLEPEADEPAVMEKIRAVLVAYGVRSPNPPKLRRDRPAIHLDDVPLGVQVSITPIKGGARVEVEGTKVRSFRVVPSNLKAIAQGLADAWCQVVGKIPVEIVSVSIGDDGQIRIVAGEDEHETVGTGDVKFGREEALARAVGRALGLVEAPLIPAANSHP